MGQFSLDTIEQLYRVRGSQQYGNEAVSQLEHALQCATLAQERGASNATITACFLHDIGHLLHNLGEDIAERGVDDHHEYRAIPYLKSLFGPEVTEPIRLHVNAKRYLCAIDEGYWASLSSASQRSLKLQGGVFSESDAKTFIQQPFASEAVELRQCDDLAKVTNKTTPTIATFLATANVNLR
ncbi:MAG: phosphonate degradation HD-domain oxygenase [Cyanobacteria bacterium P01_E01_bin.34]